MLSQVTKRIVFYTTMFAFASCTKQSNETPIVTAVASIENNILIFETGIYDWPKHRFFANVSITNIDSGKMYHIPISGQYWSPDRKDGKQDIFKLEIALASPAIHSEPVPFYQNTLYRIDYTIDSPADAWFGGPYFRGSASCYLIYHDKTGLKTLLDSTQKKVKLLTTAPITLRN